MSNNDDFGTFGRYQETPVAEMRPEMKDAYDFTVKLRGQVPGPHKIWLANPKLSKTIVPTGLLLPEGVDALTKAEIEIVTNVINGRWLAAYSNYEHEKIGRGRKATFRSRKGAGAHRQPPDQLRRSPTRRSSTSWR